MHHSAALSIAFCVFTAAAQDAPKPQFTARELFYSAGSDTPAKPAVTKPPTTPSQAPKQVSSAAKKPPVQTPPVVKTPAVAPPTVSTPTQVAVSQPEVQPSQPSSRPEGVQVVKAALVTAPAPENGTPLGLKYTILKKVGDEMVEVAPDTVFHSGDRIQISVQTNGPGYLYVINKGTSGTWRPMFPSPELADGNNHVDGWSASLLPPKARWFFDENTGIDHLFVVFSRTPEDGLENMIYSLKGNKAKPASDKADDHSNKKFVMIASADIPDSTVGQLRETYTRDLIIEKVDEKTEDKSAAKKENAVYVVNPSGSPDSRIVADLQLVHQ